MNNKDDLSPIQKTIAILAVTGVVLGVVGVIFWIKWSIYFAAHPGASWWTFFIH